MTEKTLQVHSETPQDGVTRTGTQSIERVVDVLRVIASRGRRGMRAGEVVATSGLAEATCFRMLNRLELEGMVDRDPHSRKYFLGPLLYEFGLLARPRYRLGELCDAPLHRLAEFTQDTVYLSERSGLEAVCANRALGDFPIKSLSLDIGIRRPLGVGAGGLAILCSLPPAESRAVVEANAHRYEKFAIVHGRLPLRRDRRGPGPWLLFPGRGSDSGNGIDGRRLPAKQPGGGDQRRRDLEPPAARTPRNHRAADAP